MSRERPKARAGRGCRHRRRCERGHGHKRRRELAAGLVLALLLVGIFAWSAQVARCGRVGHDAEGLVLVQGQQVQQGWGSGLSSFGAGTDSEMESQDRSDPETGPQAREIASPSTPVTSLQAESSAFELAKTIAAPEAAEGLSTELGPMLRFETHETLPDYATRLLKSYEGVENCELIRAGYLDLAGRIWSCVVLGSGWVDTCIVQEKDEQICEVFVLRGDSKLWEESDVRALSKTFSNTNRKG